ncbi:MAG: hypothetical protein HQL51_11135 [Magnetococcales bacterium]|nr:hypothetical protein [Magnetococcales bacterium]
MNQRMLISLNWTIGTMLLVAALFYPVLDDKFLTGMKKKAAEQVVDRIVRLQDENYQLHERYIEFLPDALPQDFRQKMGRDLNTVDDFVYEAMVNAQGMLEVRAHAADKLIKSGDLPPLTFTYRKNPVDKQVTREWTKYSNKKPGLI